MTICGLSTACAEEAEEFTGEQFLNWPRESQDSLIQNSITMTAIIATQGREDIARCIDEWYPLDESIIKMRHDHILKIIGENPTYHPQGVILAVIQKQCGSFRDNEN